MSQPIPPPPPITPPLHAPTKKPLWKRTWFWVAVVIFLLIVAPLASMEPDTGNQAAPTTPEATAAPTTAAPTEEPTEEPATPSPEPEPEPDPQPKPPKPIVKQGSGSKVLTLRLHADSPLVLTARHSGSSNFIVELVGPGANELLINDIGSYDGQVAYAAAKPGRYRVPVDADGSWTLRLEQPLPGAGKAIPGTIKGRGPEVVAIRASDDLQPIVSGAHKGQSNFIVYLIGYGSLKGEILLFNEIGNFRGQELVNDMPAGPYLLAVDGDGRWTIQFKR